VRLIEIAATLALNQFQKRYTPVMITNDPLLQAEEICLTAAKTKAWNDRFAAESAAYPPTLEDVLWIVAKSGYTKEVAPFMNLSKATRECKNLQRVMREVMNWRKVERGGRSPVYRGGMTQLRFFCSKGMTSSVKRMLDMKSIDVEARLGDREDGHTCLMRAASKGRLDICRLLIEKGAQVKVNDANGYTPLHFAAQDGHIELARLLCDRGADVEARVTTFWHPGSRSLNFAAMYGHICRERAH